MTFICRNFIPHVFLEILPRYCKLIILGTLDTWRHTPKVSLSTFIYQLKKLSSLSIAKKSTSVLAFFWRYCKDMQIYLFVFFGTLGIPGLHESLFYVILYRFCPNLHKNEFSWNKGLCQFLNIPIIYRYAEKSGKALPTDS